MPKKMLRKNLKYSIIEGSFFALMYGMGENYISALGVFLGYSALQISILSSFPQLIGAFSQLVTYKLTNLFGSVKKFAVVLAFLQAGMWLILVIIINKTNSYMVILGWSSIYFILTSLIGPAWISWIGYIVPFKLRSNYHANRNRIINSFIFISIMIGGIIIKIFGANLLYAFTIMFCLAALGRFLSAYYLNKKDEYYETQNNYTFSYKDILKNKLKKWFIIYNTSIHFSVMFLGPLFTIYILRTMDLSYFVLTVCMVTWWIGNVSSSTYWGRVTKKHGNLFLLKNSTVLMCILPLFWISVYYLNYEFRILVSVLINLIAGITFSGFGLSSFNFIYDISESDEVIKFSSMVNCLKGIGIFLGSVIAGFIVDSVYIINILSEYNFTSIQFSMLISIILRILSLLTIYKLAYYKNEYKKNRLTANV